MALEMLLIHDVVRLANAGAGFTMDATMKTTHDLILIANAASKSGARITFSKILPMRPVDDLISIANAGKGAITFTD